MKIHLLSNKIISSPEQINNYITCISYGLSICFNKIDAVELIWITFDDIKNGDLYGEILLTCIQPNYSEFNCDYELLTSKFKQLYFFGDGCFRRGYKNKITLSTICPTDESKFLFNVPWAGFPEYQFPEQPDDGFIHILLDHWDYSKDKKGVIVKKYWNALRKLSKKHKIKVDIITPSGIKPFDLDNFIQEDAVQIGGLSWIELMTKLRCYHIFGVTHKESGGLSVLESGMCGSTVIIPKGFIKPLIKRQVNFAETKSRVADRLGKNIPEKEIYGCLKKSIENLDVNSNFIKVKEQSWSKTGKEIYRIMNCLKNKKIKYRANLKKAILKVVINIILPFVNKSNQNALKEFYKYGE